MKIDLNPEFRKALNLMEETGSSLFITGRAGTGKSTLLEYFRSRTEKKPAMLAPTGVAALNVSGQTIHRFFNFQIDITPEKIRNRDVRRPRGVKLYRKLGMIVIDEVSMLRADLLDCVNEFLRIYGPKRGTPFGGVQMVFVGDLYQLPPVVAGEERKLFGEIYETPYFFGSRALEDFPLEIVELETVYRQKDEKFITLLNKIRNNSVEDRDIEELNRRYGAKLPAGEDDFTVTLTSTNRKADEINKNLLDALEGDLYESAARIEGDFGREYFPTETVLRFKIGAQIMLLNNDPKERWVNGSVGVIETLQEEENGGTRLLVRLRDDKRLVSVAPFKWEIYRFSVMKGEIVSEPVGSFTQYPFRLAWAITIHKSQGKTFERVIVDIGRGTFASGQMYVALSRCVSFEGLVLKTPVKKGHIRVDYGIHKFLTSQAYEKAEKNMSTEDKVKFIAQAINDETRFEMTYLKTDNTKSRRTVKPLTVGKENYGGKSFLGMRAYCYARRDERMFRVDRILELRKTESS